MAHIRQSGPESNPGFQVNQIDRLRVGWLNGCSFIASRRGAARAEDAPGTPTQSHISPSKLVNEDGTSIVILFRSAAAWPDTQGPTGVGCVL